MRNDNSPDSSIVVRRAYAHSRERVFQAFSEPAQLSRWLAPRTDIGAKVAAFDFNVGGQYRIIFAMPDRTTGAITGTYKVIEPPTQLAFTWCWEAPDPHAGIDTLVTANFIARDSGCELVITHTQLYDQPMKTRHGQGWPASLARLSTWLDEKEDHK